LASKPWAQAHAYAQAYEKVVDNDKGSGATQTYNIVDNSNDAALTIVDVNGTTTTTYTLTVRRFASTSAATTFFNSVAPGPSGTGLTGTLDPYLELTGHPATVNTVSHNTSSNGMNNGYALQQDNFVTYGTINIAQL
jgi:hypothetical protein